MSVNITRHLFLLVILNLGLKDNLDYTQVIEMMCA